MPRQKRFPPYPSKAHPCGQARIRVGHDQVYLGPFGSPASWERYNQLLREWNERQARGESPLPPRLAPRTLADLAAHFWPHAEERYPRPADSRESRELGNYKDALGLLLNLHRTTRVADFGPRALKGWLRAAAGRWCRRVANRHLARVKTFWRWCESEELVPAGSTHALATVRGLAEGEHGARERPEVPPAPAEAIAAALVELNPVARALVECLLLTGARPGELFRLTPADLNRSGEVELARGYRVRLGAGVWAVQPRLHKTARKGKRRVILFGPRAQAILAPLLEGRPADKPIFCPQEARKTPVKGRRAPKLRYDRRSLSTAVRRACLRAGVEPWTPYSLRHAAATNLNAEFGPEVARIVLGHADLKTTSTYIVDDLAKAAEALGKVG